MSDEPNDRDFEQTTQHLRQRLEKTRAKCDEFIANRDYLAEHRSHLASAIAPDRYVEVYAIRAWAIKALAMLDAGEEIPPPPTPDD